MNMMEYYNFDGGVLINTIYVYIHLNHFNDIQNHDFNKIP